MSHIFISHVEEDAAIAREIANGLESAGYSTWHYQRDTVPGAEYLTQVRQAIEECQATVLIVSPNSIESHQVTSEVVRAFESKKHFIPVLYGITDAEFKERQPLWGQALGASTSITIPREGASAIVPRIIDGLKALGIQPEVSGERALPHVPTPASYTPRHLADKIIAARPAMEGERKQVTVLLVEVGGFSSVSGKLDPEEVHSLFNRCLDHFIEEIHRYEGTIAQFLRNGVIALFGAPIAHEDAPQRALYAALGIQGCLGHCAEQFKEQGIKFEMRMGVNTGLVVVGKIGDDLTMEYTAMGDTVDLASEMESRAAPGTIQVAESTYRLTRDYFEFQPLSELQVKGEPEPVKAYHLVGAGPVSTRLGAAVARGLTHFVGRRRELEHLSDCFKRASEGQGQVLGVVGEAGVGKSRLILELRQRLPGEEYTYLEGRCLHFGGSMAYLPWLDILRSYFDIEEGEQGSVSRHKMEDKIAAVDQKLAGILPPLCEILSLGVEDERYLKLDVQRKRQMTFEAIRNLLIHESQNRPLVLAIEDLHWIDNTSEEFLNYLIGWLANARILLLLLYRPEYAHLWASKSCYSQVRVDQLSTGTSAELVQSILEEGEVVPDLRELILARAGGNPLFVEEFTHTLVENGSIQKKDHQYVLSTKASEIQVPDTIQGIIAARMDRLEESLKQTLQVASVIGRDFAYRILQTITGMREELESCLLDLQSLEFIYEKSLFPELEYIFKHALTQEVAYNSLLLKRRKKIHERIGLAIEQLYPDRLEEFYEALAFHFKQGESPDKSIDYFIKSGEKSYDRYAVEESHQHFQQAFDILSNKPGRTKEEDALLIDLLIKWAYVFYFRGDFRGLTDLLGAHRDLAESMGDKARLGMFYGWLGLALYCRGKAKDSYKYLRKALTVAEEIGDQKVIGYACAWLIFTCEELGLLDEAIAHGERAQKIAGAFESDQYLYFKSLDGIGQAYFFKGDRKKTFEAGKALLEYGESHASIRSLVVGHYIMGLSYYMDGDLPSAIECQQRGLEVSADPFYALIPRMMLGVVYVMNGQFQEGEDAVREVLAFSRDFGCESMEAPCHALLGLVAIAEGQVSEGLRLAESALQSVLEEGRKMFAAQFHEGIGKVYPLLAGTVPKAEEKAVDHLDKAIEVAQEIGAKGTMGMAYLDQGLLHSGRGEKDKARECITKAIRLFEECDLQTPLRQAKEALASLG